jgi:hypothetical protein
MKYASVKEWLEATERRANVVHTIEKGKAVRAERQEDGSWDVRPEPWEYGENR